MQPVYLDNNATTRPADEVVDAVTRALRELWANPSSVHRAGQMVRQQVELAREQVARLVNCRGQELVFTSGGTESTNHAIRGSLRAQPTRSVVVTDRLEHSATRETAEALEQRGTEVVWLESDASGVVDLDSLEDLLKSRADEVAVVSVQWANNETGAIQPVEKVGALCREHGVRFHCDGTQWVGKMTTDLTSTPIDLMSFAAHKFHGPKGVGALFVRRGVRLPAEITGGPQERERRGGTENVPGVIGMGVAADLARRWLESQPASAPATRAGGEGHHLPSPPGRGAGGEGDDLPSPRGRGAGGEGDDLPSPRGRGAGGEGERPSPPATHPFRARRDRFERAILDATGDAVVNAADVERLWNTSNIAFPRLEAEAILLLLSERGVYASAGAACSSGSLDPSPVLLAMGVAPEVAHGSVRFSISRETTDEEIDRAVEIVPAVIEKLRSSMAAI